MKKILSSIALFLAAAPAFAGHQLTCFNDNNGDYILEIQFDEQGTAITAQFSNQDWGEAGINAPQDLRLRERRMDMTEYDLSDTGLSLIIPDKVRDGKFGAISVITDMSDQIVTHEKYSCN